MVINLYSAEPAEPSTVLQDTSLTISSPETFKILMSEPLVTACALFTEMPGAGGNLPVILNHFRK